MGSKSKSSSSSTTGNVSGQMGGLDKYRVSNDQMAGMQQDMANSQWEKMAPMLDALKQMGTQQMASNPMAVLMGQMFGQEQPPQEQQQPQPQGMPQGIPLVPFEGTPQGMPQQQQLQTGGGLGMDPRAPRDMTAHEQGNPTAMPQGAMGNMTPEQMAAIQSMQGYGRR